MEKVEKVPRRVRQNRIFPKPLDFEEVAESSSFARSGVPKKEPKHGGNAKLLHVRRQKWAEVTETESGNFCHRRLLCEVGMSD